MQQQQPSARKNNSKQLQQYRTVLTKRGGESNNQDSSFLQTPQQQQQQQMRQIFPNSKRFSIDHKQYENKTRRRELRSSNRNSTLSVSQDDGEEKQHQINNMRGSQGSLRQKAKVDQNRSSIYERQQHAQSLSPLSVRGGGGQANTVKKHQIMTYSANNLLLKGRETLSGEGSPHFAGGEYYPPPYQDNSLGLLYSNSNLNKSFIANPRGN